MKQRFNFTVFYLKLAFHSFIPSWLFLSWRNLLWNTSSQYLDFFNKLTHFYVFTLINQSKIWSKISKISEKLMPRISFYQIRAHIWQVLFWKVTWTHTCCQLVSLQKMPTRTTLAFFRSKMASNFVEKCTTYVLRRIPTTLFKMFPSNILA